MLENFKRLDPQKYADAPEWFHMFMEQYNRTQEDVVSLLQAGLTSENEDAEIMLLNVQHGVAITVNHPDVVSTPEECRVVYSETALTSFHWRMAAEGQVTITCEFSGSPAAYQTIHLKVRGS